MIVILISVANVALAIFSLVTFHKAGSLLDRARAVLANAPQHEGPE